MSRGHYGNLPNESLFFSRSSGKMGNLFNTHNWTDQFNYIARNVVFCFSSTRIDGVEHLSKEPTKAFALCQAMVAQIYPNATVKGSGVRFAYVTQL